MNTKTVLDKDYSFYVIEQHENVLSLNVLTENISLRKKGFCILPYQNPLVAKPIAKFYETGAEEIIQIKDQQLKVNEPIQLHCTISKNDYINRVKKLKNEIQKGNIYEINYCIEFYAENVEIDPLSVDLKLDELTKAPFSRLVKDGEDYIICASPELFLKKQGGLLYTKPIKGTVKRGTGMEEDEQLKNHLYNSVKERTENVMAVDVARNDLSRIAKRGSVNVNKLYNIESYQTVHQMVSTVSCELKEELSFADIIDATFPMASMTGAPKIKAMELIDANENFKRNYYSGAMGFIDNGDFELAVVIRSIFYNTRTKRLSIAVGSAITHLCDAEEEYNECLLKAGALLKALNATINN
ncbi:MAG: chorismate-binding protein [Bacteroidia bacterium]